MTHTVNITDFRREIFKYADMVLGGDEVEIIRGRDRLKLSSVKDDLKKRGERLYRLLSKLGGKFPDWPYDREEFRGKAEIRREKERLKRIGL